MTHLDLAITTDLLRQSRLRADAIRRDTLVQLAAAWREDSSAVIDALDALAEVVRSPHDTEGAEIDGACDDLETVCDMGPAEMDLTRADVQQLLDQATAARQAMAPAVTYPTLSAAGTEVAA